MDTNIPQNDGLIDIERRLAEWSPLSGSSNSDTMLFAAGYAAGRGVMPRCVWPVICILLVLQSVGLAIWAFSERGERRFLESQLREATPSVPAANVPPVLPEPTYEPSPQDYYHLLREVEQDPISWLAPPSPGQLPPVPPMEKPSLRRSVQQESLFDL
jgi:hypothetical protein